VLSFADRLVVLDHHEQQIYVVAVHDNTPRVRHSAGEWLTDTCAALHPQVVPAPGGANSAAVDAGSHAQAQTLCVGVQPLAAAMDSASDDSIRTKQQEPGVHGPFYPSQAAPHAVLKDAAANAVASSGSSFLGCGSASDISSKDSAAREDQKNVSCDEPWHGSRSATSITSSSQLSTPCSKHLVRADGSARSEPCMVPSGPLSCCNRVLVTEDGAVLHSAPESQNNGHCPDQSRTDREHSDHKRAASGHEVRHDPAADSRHLIGEPMVEGNSFRPARSRAQYLKDIDECKEALYEGNSYEICLTNALHCEVRNWDAWKFYRVLRKVNPAPYSAWLHCGEVRFMPYLFVMRTNALSDSCIDTRAVKFFIMVVDSDRQ
jgi:hypothetical protein